MTLLLLLTLLPNFSITHSQAPATLESDDPRVIQAGTWSNQPSAAASNGGYLFSGGAEEDVLALAFVGSAIEIIYVAGPQFGTLAIEVDGTVLRTVISTSEKIEYGQAARVDYLSDEPHSVKVYAQAGGLVAVDAFVITPNLPTALPVNNDEMGGVQATHCAPMNATHRVSLGSDGQQANDNSFVPSLSTNGRYIAFASRATNLVAGDTNGGQDIFVYDRQTCAIHLVSISSDGLVGNGDSSYPQLSGDGRYVAFESHASNLVSGDTNAESDIFVHDRNTGTTTRISVNSIGAQTTGGVTRYPAISSDGRYVAFESHASNLVSGDTNGLADIFVHDRQTNTTTRVSVATGGTPTIGEGSFNPDISADGRYVVFGSRASNLVSGDTNGLADIFVHDRQTNTTTRVSVSTGGTQADSASGGAALSSDGRYIAFESSATNLVSGDTNGFDDVFVYDRQTNITTRVSVATDGTQGTDGFSGGPKISDDGRYITFVATATDLVIGDTNGHWDSFLHDRNTSTTLRISVSTTGAQAIGGSSFFATLSPDGNYIAFQSPAANLVGGDTNGVQDIFVAPRIRPPTDTLALFNPAVEQVNLIDTLADNPAAERYTAFSAYAPPTSAGQWVMGDWNGDGLKTPGVYLNGPFYYTNRMGETTASDWRSLWIGVAGPPVSGRFNGALPNDCIGAVQSANFPPFGTAFVLYYTCDLSGNTAPTIAFQWLSVVLPDSGGFAGTHQFKAGDFNSDGLDSVAVRRGNTIAFGNVAPAQGHATFDLAQYIGAPSLNDEGIFVVGDWDADRIDSFGLFYQNGEFFYRNDLTFNSGVYVNQSVGTPFGNTGVQATTWR